ncbi:MAG: hypothetical protein LBJ80_00930 [Rickettsiales bacterium]|nr:hypothetical protein [Rickettsiales bacterium]
MEVINLMLKHSVNFSGFQIGTTWNDTRNLMFIKPICKQSLLDPSVKHTTVRTLQFEPTRRMSSQCPDTGIQQN